MAKLERDERLSIWVIILLILGSPIWLSLIIAVFAVVLSLYITLWAVIVSLWAVFATFVGCSFGGAVIGCCYTLCGDTLSGLAMLSASISLAGLAIFAFFGCKSATKGTVWLTKKGAVGIKRCFVVGEN